MGVRVLGDVETCRRVENLIVAIGRGKDEELVHKVGGCAGKTNDANNLFDQTFGHFVYTAFIVGARGDHVDDPNHRLTTLRLGSP